MPVVVRPLADVPGEARRERRSSTPPNPSRPPRSTRPGSSSSRPAPAPARRPCSSSASCARSASAGVDVDSILVITYTERAAGELRGADPRAAASSSAAHDLARELDGAWISTIHGFCHRLLQAHPFAAGLDPRFRVLDESQARVLRGEAFDDGAGRSSAPAASPSGCGCSPPTAPRAAPDADRRLRDAALRGPAARARARRAARARRRARRAARGGAAASPTTRARPTLQRASAARALDAARRATPRAERLLDLAELHAARGERAATLRGGAQARRAGGARRARRARPRAAPGAARRASPTRTARRRTASRRSTSRTSSCARATCSRDDDGDPRARAAALPLDHGRRVPGHEPAPVRADRPARARRRSSSSSATSSSRSTASATPTSRSSASGASSVGGVLAADRRTTARGPRCSRSSTTSSPPTSATSSSRSPPPGGSPTRLRARRSSCSSPTRRATRDTGVALAARRGAARRARACASSSTRARRRRARSCSSSPPARTPSGTRRSCARPGLPTYRATGRGYFGQQQVVDLLAYLRLLHNRYDDEALVTVLASPFVGVSNDALVLLRRAAERRPLFTGHRARAARGPRRARRAALARVPPALRPARRRSRRGSRSSGSASRSSPSTTTTSPCSRSGTAGAATRTCASSRGSRARTRSCAGRDVEGFVRFVARAGGRRRARARGGRRGGGRGRGAAADDPRARRGSSSRSSSSPTRAATARARARDEILCLAGRPVRLPGRRPGDGQAARRLRLRRGAGGRARRPRRRERLRLYYVAMTRAIDRLIVSGSIDPSASADERDADRLGARPARAPASSTARRRAGRARARRRAAAAARRPVRARSRRPRREPSAPRTAQLALFAAEDGRRAAPRRPSCRRSSRCPTPPLHRVRRLSYSALALFERCSYRYYAERVVGLRPRRRRGAVAGQTGLAATEIGDAVHRLLERVDLAAPAPPDGSTRVRAWYPAATDEELERIARLVAAYCDSELARARSPRSPARGRERPFAFEHDGVLLHGRLDVLHATAARALVVDYKTNVARRASPEEVVEARVPAPAARLRARLLPRRAPTRSRSSTSSSSGPTSRRRRPVRARRRCRRSRPSCPRRSRAIQAGEFRPTPSEFACAGCPALDVVCAGPRRCGDDRRASMARSYVARGAAARRARSASGSGRSSSGSRAEHPDATIALRFAHRPRAARLGDALGADDRREREPRHRDAVREVPPARGLPRGAASRSSSATSARPASSARRRRRSAGRCRC